MITKQIKKRENSKRDELSQLVIKNRENYIRSTRMFIKATGKRYSATKKIDYKTHIKLFNIIDSKDTFDRGMFEDMCFYFLDIESIYAELFYHPFLTEDFFDSITKDKNLDEGAVLFLFYRSDVENDFMFKVGASCSQTDSYSAKNAKEHLLRFVDKEESPLPRMKAALQSRGISTEGLPNEYVIDLFFLESSNVT